MLGKGVQGVHVRGVMPWNLPMEFDSKGFYYHRKQKKEDSKTRYLLYTFNMNLELILA